MRPVRAAALLVLLGIWLGGTAFMWAVAIQTFSNAERIASTWGGLREGEQGVSSEGLRMALRYQASEVNRALFQGWGPVQLALAAACMGLAWSARPGWGLRILVLLVSAIAAAQTAWLVPETVRLGRMIDFSAPTALPEVRGAFWKLHGWYSTLDAVKIAALLMGSIAGCLNWSDYRVLPK